MNPKDSDEKRFKWAVIAPLHNEDIGNNIGRISKPQYCEDQFNRQVVAFLLVIQKIGTFEKKNPGITVNVLFNSKKGNLYNLHIRS